MSADFEWTGNLDVRLRDFASKRGPKMALAATGKYMAPKIEGDARQKAPWTDRTGNARQGLNAQYEVDDHGLKITLAHQVPYGIYLETRWSGKYQIIPPTIQKWAPKVFEMAGKLMMKDPIP